MASKELMLRVARMSHEQHMTNQEIADALFREKLLPSRNAKKIQPIIDEAGVWLLQEHERLVQSESANGPEAELASRLCRHFDLMDARVVSGGATRNPLEYAALVRRYGQVAADYFDEIASAAESAGEELHVAVGGGQTILDMMSSLMPRTRSNVSFCAAALIGRGRVPRTTHVIPSTNATVGWSRSGRLLGKLHYGTITPYPIGPSTFQDMSARESYRYARELIGAEMKRLAESKEVREVLEDMTASINIAIAGLGVLQHTEADDRYGIGHTERLSITSLLRPLGISPELLMKEGAVGDLCYSIFDADGKGRAEWQHFLTVGHGTRWPGVEFYRRLVKQDRPVIVSAGHRKEKAILPAIKAELFNVLITDAHTAEALLKA